MDNRRPSKGHVDSLTNSFVGGWALQNAFGSATVDVIVDGQRLGSADCKYRREDLVELGVTNDDAGFAFEFPSPLSPFEDHEVRIQIRGATDFLPGPSRLSAVTIRMAATQSRGPVAVLPETLPKVAVLIRTHLVCPKLINLLEQLKSSPFFDLYVLADETRSPIDLPQYNVVSHSVEMCKYLGLATNHNAILWYCGDYPFYCAAHQLPDYDYYLQIEYDVSFARQSPLFIEGIISRLSGSDGVPFDYIAAFLWPNMQDAWMWKRNAAKIYGDNVYGGIFAFILLSKGALEFLYEQRLAEAERGTETEALIHCEAFAATALMRAELFKCGQVDDLIRGSVNQRSFHPAFPDLHMPNFLLGDSIDADPRVEMYHPVFDVEAYLSKALSHATQYKTFKNFQEMVRTLSPQLVSEEMRMKFLTSVGKLMDRTLMQEAVRQRA